MSDQLKKCEVCGADMAKNAKTCPGCGAKNKKPIYKRVWFWVVVVVLVLAVAGSRSGDSSNSSSADPGQGAEVQQSAPQGDSTAPTEAPVEEKKDPLTIEGEVSTEYDGFYTYITGIIKNNTDKDKSYVQVTFNLYDSSGNLVDAAVDNITNLAAGGTWKFKAIELAEDVASYEFAGIDAW